MYISLISFLDRRCQGLRRPRSGQPGRRRTVHEQGGLAGCWPRSRHGREEPVTDVIDGSSAANGQPGRKDERESFSTMAVGNSPDRDAQALTPTIGRPWATRQMGSPRPVTPESIAPVAEAASRREVTTASGDSA